MGKVRLNADQEVVALIREGLKRTGGYCPCRLARTPENTPISRALPLPPLLQRKINHLTEFAAPQRRE